MMLLFELLIWTNWWLTLGSEVLLYSSWIRGGGPLAGGSAAKERWTLAEWDLDDFNVNDRAAGFSPCCHGYLKLKPINFPHKWKRDKKIEFWGIFQNDANWLANHWSDFHGYAYKRGGGGVCPPCASNGYFQFGSSLARPWIPTVALSSALPLDIVWGGGRGSCLRRLVPESLCDSLSCPVKHKNACFEHCILTWLRPIALSFDSLALLPTDISKNDQGYLIPVLNFKRKPV